MNLEHAQKLLAVKEGAELIALNKKAAEDLSEHVTNLTTMLVGVEPCKLTVDEFRELMIRLCPDSKRLMEHTVGVSRIVNAVTEHLFLTGSGDPTDIAKFRHQLRVLEKTGKLDLLSQ